MCEDLRRGGFAVHTLELWYSGGYSNTTFLPVLIPSSHPSLPFPTLAQVSLLIRRELTERAKDFSLILDDVAITELSFSREYTAAVEAKQVGKPPEE